MKQLILLPLLLFFACQSEQPAPPTSTTTQVSTPDTTTNLGPDIRKGNKLFSDNCASCHISNMISKSTGSPLGGITQRRSKEWLHKFTRNNWQLYTEGDSITQALFPNYQGSLMPNYTFLDSMDIENIYAYVDSVYEAERPRIRLRRVYPYLID